MLSPTDLRFTKRELEILELIVNDYLSNKEIACELGTTEQVIKNHLRRIYNHAGLHGSVARKRITLWRMLHIPADKTPTNATFSQRQAAIAEMVSIGSTNAQIAERFAVSVPVIKKYIEGLFNKTGVWSRLELAAWVEAHGQ